MPPILTGVADLLRLRRAKTDESSSFPAKFSWLPMVIPETLMGFLERRKPLISLYEFSPGGSELPRIKVLAGEEESGGDADDGATAAF